MFLEEDAKKAKHMQANKLQQMREVYAENLQELLLQKQTLEKELKREQRARHKHEGKHREMKAKVEAEIKHMRQKIEDEFRLNFDIRKNSLWHKFQEEQTRIAAQYAEMKSFQMKKDTVLFRLCRTIIEQE